MKTILLALLVLHGSFTVYGQQKRPLVFNKPQKLNEIVNTRSEELMPWVYNNGRNLILTRKLSRKKNRVLGFSRKDLHAQWEATPGFRPFRDVDKGFLIGISNNGDTLYQLRANSAEKMLSIYRIISSTKRVTPVILRLPFLGNFYSAYISNDESVILLSIRTEGSRGLEDLFSVRKDARGKWMKPVSLGSMINTTGFETSPFLSADQRTLFFSSDRPGGFGDADIYYSNRLDDSWQKWSAPVNLGKEINSSHFDAYLSVASNGEAYFASSKEATLSDIYAVTYGPARVNFQPEMPVDSLKEAIIAEPVSEVHDVESNLQHDVIVAVFRHLSNATKFQRKIRAFYPGSDLFFDGTRQLYYITVFNTRSLEDARSRRDTLRVSGERDLSEAWVLTRKMDR